MPPRSPPAAPEGARESDKRESVACTTVPAVVPPLAARVTTPAAEVLAAETLTTGLAEVPPTEMGAVPVTLDTPPPPPPDPITTGVPLPSEYFT